MHVVNALLAGFALLLEGGLLWILVRSGAYRRQPLFAALLLFYALRGCAFLAAGFGAGHALSPNLVSSLALIDIALQVALAGSLFLRLSRAGLDGGASGHPLLRRALLPGAMLLAIGFTMLLVWALPPYSPVPVDRGTAVCAFFFLLLLLAAENQGAAARRQPSMESRLLQSFAVFGLVQIAAQGGKAFAALHREPRLFLFWAYLDAAVWLLVLLAWVLLFRRRSGAGAKFLARGTAWPAKIS